MRDCLRPIHSRALREGGLSRSQGEGGGGGHSAGSGNQGQDQGAAGIRRLADASPGWGEGEGRGATGGFPLGERGHTLDWGTQILSKLQEWARRKYLRGRAGATATCLLGPYSTRKVVHTGGLFFGCRRLRITRKGRLLEVVTLYIVHLTIEDQRASPLPVSDGLAKSHVQLTHPQPPACSFSGSSACFLPSLSFLF